MRTYEHKPPQAPDGMEFEKFCISLYRDLLGESLTRCETPQEQYQIGDTHQGHEFKFLKKSGARLHIEIAENNDTKNWFPSGIYAGRRHGQRRRRWFVCGNFLAIFDFKIETLIEWHKTTSPREVIYGKDADGRWRTGDVGDQSLQATIRSFVLDKADAMRMCRFQFTNVDGKWSVRRNEKPPADLDCGLAQALDALNRRAALWQQPPPPPPPSGIYGIVWRRYFPPLQRDEEQA